MRAVKPTSTTNKMANSVFHTVCPSPLLRLGHSTHLEENLLQGGQEQEINYPHRLKTEGDDEGGVNHEGRLRQAGVQHPRWIRQLERSQSPR